jgi:hypothetical protein
VAKIRKQERLPDNTGTWDPATRKGAMSAIANPNWHVRNPEYELQPDGYMMDPITGGFPPPPMPALGTPGTVSEQMQLPLGKTKAEEAALYDDGPGI